MRYNKLSSFVRCKVLKYEWLWTWHLRPSMSNWISHLDFYILLPIIVFTISNIAQQSSFETCLENLSDTELYLSRSLKMKSNRAVRIPTNDLLLVSITPWNFFAYLLSLGQKWRTAAPTLTTAHFMFSKSDHFFLDRGKAPTENKVNW